MFVFAETGASAGDDGGGAPSALFELQDGALKEQLPFEELVVVAGLQTPARASVAAGAGSDPSFLRQLTSISARIKPLARRLLLVLAVPVAASNSATSVQILDVGEGAVNFVHDVRGCFPTLVRRNPMSYAPDSDDESDNDADNDDDMDDEQRAQGAEETASKRLKQETAEQIEAQEKATIEREAVEFMDRTRVKLLQSLDELFHAFPIQNQSQVREALLQEEEETALTMSQSHSRMTCQWLCVDLPALKAPSGHSNNSSSTTNSAGSTTVVSHNFGLMLSHAAASASSARGERFLTIPLPRPPRGYFAKGHNGGDDNGADDNAASEVFQDATVLSFGAKREATTHGGGKTPEEMVKNIRMRHASGTFCTLVNPVTTWGAIVTKYAAVLPQVNELQGDLRFRRIMGPARNEPVELLLE